MGGKLVIPSREYLDSCVEAGLELHEKHVEVFELYDPEKSSADEWKEGILDTYDRWRRGVGLKKGQVPMSTFWLVEDGEFIGSGDIRHRLTYKLRLMGGHIGYTIRPSRWGRGYGTLLLRLLLAEASLLGLREVLLTCRRDNAASAAVMRNNGAVYIDTIEILVDGKKRLTSRYKIVIEREKKGT